MVCARYTSLITPSSQNALIDGIESLLVNSAGFVTVSKTDVAKSGTTFWGNNVNGGNVRELRIGKASIGLYICFRCWLSGGVFALFGHICNSTFSTIFPAEVTTSQAAGSSFGALKAATISSTTAAYYSAYNAWVQSLVSTVDLRLTLWMSSANDDYFVLTFDHQCRGVTGPGNQSQWCAFKVCEDVLSGFDPAVNWMIVGKGGYSNFALAQAGMQLVPDTHNSLLDNYHHIYTPTFNTYTSGSAPVLGVEGIGHFLAIANCPAGVGVEAPNYFGNLEILKNCWRVYLNYLNAPNRTQYALSNYVGKLSSDLAIGPGGLIGLTGDRIVVTPGTEEYDITLTKPNVMVLPYGPALYVRAV